jgi:DNA-binding XRE family transcriptional regulator
VRIDIPSGADIEATARLTSDGVEIYGPGGRLTSVPVHKGDVHILLPTATLIGTYKHETCVAWNGENYVACTLTHIVKSEGLTYVARIIPEDVAAFIYGEHEQQSATVNSVESLGQQIKRIRTECRMTNKQLAEAIDVEERQLYRHQSDQTSPRLDHVAAYEKVFSDCLKRSVTLQRQ